MGTNGKGVVMTALMPHPPIVVPGVGHGREREAQRTVDAMKHLAGHIVAARPEVLVLISPHSPRRPGSFGIWGGTRLRGTLEAFRAPQESVNLPADPEFLAALARTAGALQVRTHEIRGEELDHGAMVPLCYLRDAGWRGPTVVTALNYPGDGHLEQFGAAIREAAVTLGRRTAVLASGDMSHRLAPGAPGGYHPDAHKFDESFVNCVEHCDAGTLRRFDERLREIAGEDVVDSTLVALASANFRMQGCRLLSYEGPFGVGYSVALLDDELNDPTPLSEPKEAEDAFSPARMARTAVEDHLCGRPTAAPRDVPLPFRQRAGVFVTIRNRDGELRGCIGTLTPQFPTLVEETIDRAIAAALRDPRFSPVSLEEMANLTFEVSVLHPAERVESPSALDPARYGVVVSDSQGRRAVMLPGIESLETVEKQLEATRRKAGIPEGAAVLIERFEVDKYEEDDL